MALLLLDESHGLLAVLADMTHVGAAGDELARSLVGLFERHERTLELLTVLVEREVARSSQAATLFRGEDLASRAIRAFTRMAGLPCAQATLEELVSEVKAGKAHIEVDPDRGATDPAASRRLLAQYTQRTLDRIVAAPLPLQFYQLANILCDCVEKKYPGKARIGLAGFIFLRFWNPAILSPETFGIADRVPCTDLAGARRTLLLIGKLIQNLVNGTPFSEESLKPLNSFLEQNEGKMARYLHSLTVVPADRGPTPLLALPVLDASLDFVTSVLRRQRDELQQRLADSTEPHEQLVRFNVTSLAVNLCGEILSPQPTLTLRTSCHSLGDLLLSSKELLTALCTTIDELQTIVPEARAATDGLVAVLQVSGQFAQALGHIITASRFLSEYQFVHSIAVRLVSLWSQRFAADWVRATVSETLDEIIAADRLLDPAAAEVKLRRQSQAKLKRYSHILFLNCAHSVATAPLVLQQVLASVADAHLDPWQFLLLAVLCRVVEKPELWGLERPGARAGESLSTLAEVIRNVAFGDSFYIQDIPVEQARLREAVVVFEEHMAHLMAAPEGGSEAPLLGADELAAFRQVAEFCLHPRVQTSLHSLVPSHCLTVQKLKFRLPELVPCLNLSESEPEEPGHVALPTVLGSPPVEHRGLGRRRLEKARHRLSHVVERKKK